MIRRCLTRPCIAERLIPSLSVVAAVMLLAACADAGIAELPRRELAWCMDKPGAIGSLASDTGIEIPAQAQAAVDDGIYDKAGQWRYRDAWEPATYARLCADAYDQFGGADDEVDMSVLTPAARLASPTPTGNVTTADLRSRAAEFVPQLEAAGEALVEALEARDDARVRAAAEQLQEMTAAETEALFDVVTEPCYTDAGAAYGMTIFNWEVTANNLLRYLDAGEEDARAVAADFAGDAIESAAEWRRLDATAC